MVDTPYAKANGTQPDLAFMVQQTRVNSQHHTLWNTDDCQTCTMMRDGGLIYQHDNGVDLKVSMDYAN